MANQQTSAKPGGHFRDPDQATDYVQRLRQRDDRLPVFELMAKLIPHETHDALTVLDIGSGQAPAASACLATFPNAHAVGLDFSEAMMDAGRELTAGFGDRFEYMLGDFGNGKLPANAVAAGPYDVIVSSRAIHHLTKEQMPLLYADIYTNLKWKGSFFNLDTASAEDESVRGLFKAIRLAERGPRPREARGDAPVLYHHDDATLLRHIEWLKKAGFASVEVFWKRLDTAMIGGYKW